MVPNPNTRGFLKRISWYLVHLETSLTYRPSKKWVRDLRSSLTQYGCVLSGSDLLRKKMCTSTYCLLMYGKERVANISLKMYSYMCWWLWSSLTYSIAKLRLFMCEFNSNNGVKCHVSVLCFRVNAETSFIRFLKLILTLIDSFFFV